MTRAVAIPLLSFFTLFSSCAYRTQYASEVGPWPVRPLGDDRRVQVPFSVPGSGLYDVVLWYFITDSGAGYDALGRVTGTASVSYRGHVVQQSILPRRGTRSELFTDTNGLILLRFEARSSGQYLLRLNVTSVPPHLQITGAGVRVIKLADTPRPNHTSEVI